MSAAAWRKLARRLASFGLAAAVACGAQPAGILVVDRGVQAGAPALSLGKTGAPGFVGDHFQIGKRAEVWIIDSIRTWVSAGDLTVFEKATLFGGIEPAPPAPGRPPEPECDCHNLMAIKTGRLRASGSDIAVASAGRGLWRVDLQNLHWSVPGGVPIQFGVMGEGARGPRVWPNAAASADPGHALKAFDIKGKLEGPYQPDGVAIDDRVALQVQVWAHKMATIKIRSAGTTIEVALEASSFFDPAVVDPATVRFGPGNAAPISTRTETATDGHPALVARFRRGDAGLPPAAAAACLTGRELDGAPFEGCASVNAK